MAITHYAFTQRGQGDEGVADEVGFDVVSEIVLKNDNVLEKISVISAAIARG